MIGNDHVRFGPGAAGKGPAPAGRHLASGLPEPRLARNGLIARVPDRNRYTLTPDGLLFATFYTRVWDHVLRPRMAPDRPNAPPGLADALATLDQITADSITRTRVPAAA